MNTHDIDLATEIYAASQRAPGEGMEDAIGRIAHLIEADRKRTTELIASYQEKVRALEAENHALVSDLDDRQVRGEPGGEIQCRIYHDTEQHRDYLKARFHPDAWKNRVSFEWQGHRWAYRYTHFDDSGEYDLIARPSPQHLSDSDKPADPVECFKCGHPKHIGECVNVVPQPAEPVIRESRNAYELAGLGELLDAAHAAVEVLDDMQDDPAARRASVSLSYAAAALDTRHSAEPTNKESLTVAEPVKVPSDGGMDPRNEQSEPVKAPKG